MGFGVVPSPFLMPKKGAHLCAPFFRYFTANVSLVGWVKN